MAPVTSKCPGPSAPPGRSHPGVASRIYGARLVVYVCLCPPGFINDKFFFFVFFKLEYSCFLGFPGGSVGKESACNVGDLGSTPRLRRSPGEGNGSPLQCSCLENSMDRGAWQTTVHEVAEGWTRLSDEHTHIVALHCCVSFCCTAKYSMNQPYIHIYFLFFGFPSHLDPTKHWVEFPVLYSRFLLVIYFICGKCIYVNSSLPVHPPHPWCPYLFSTSVSLPALQIRSSMSFF